MSLKEGPNAWPADVAFKRLVRELWRQRDYVPPYQNLPTPLATASEAPTDDTDSDETPWRIGGWTLTVNERDEVVFRHDSGHEQVIAALPPAEQG